MIPDWLINRMLGFITGDDSSFFKTYGEVEHNTMSDPASKQPGGSPIKNELGIVTTGLQRV